MLHSINWHHQIEYQDPCKLTKPQICKLNLFHIISFAFHTLYSTCMEHHIDV